MGLTKLLPCVVSARAFGFAGVMGTVGSPPLIFHSWPVVPTSRARDGAIQRIALTLFEARVKVTASSSSAVPGSMFSYSLVWLPQIVSGLFAVHPHQDRCWNRVTEPGNPRTVDQAPSR